MLPLLKKRLTFIVSILCMILNLSGLSYAKETTNDSSAQQPLLSQSKSFLQSQERLAYSLGIQAYIYGYPLVMSAKTMEDMVKNRAPINQFYYSDTLASPDYRDIVTPNSDTLYLSAWLDVSETPVRLTVPANPQNRYYTVQMLDAYTNTFRNVSNRSTKQQARQYIIAGPNWKGPTPAHIPVIYSPTPTVWLIGRVEVKGEADLPQAVSFEKQIAITPVHPKLEKPDVSDTIPPDVLTSLSFFQVMTKMIQSNPPPECDRVLLDQFAQAGIDIQKGFDPSSLGPAKLAGLQRALQDAPAIVQNGFPDYTAFRNGWGSFSPIGTYGNQFLARSFIAYSGIGANVPSVQAYYRALTDGSGKPLTGAKSYTLHFTKEQLPKTSAFWSINVYDNQLFLAKTAADRASVRSNTGTLAYNPDGSLDLYLQQQPPKGKEGNWLPLPGGEFNLVLRVFAPDTAVADKLHNWPPVTESKSMP